MPRKQNARAWQEKRRERAYELSTAGWQTVGWRRKAVLTIGIPLWTVLTDQERIALLGHELAHGINGDATRSFVVGGALQSLSTWNYLAWQGARVKSIVSIIFALIFIITYPGLHLLQWLMLSDKRRAEYYADYLAASVGGTDAEITGLSKLQFSENVRGFIANFRQMGIAPNTLFDRLRTYIDRVVSSPAEFEQLQKETEMTDRAFSFTHPPTQFRLDFIKAKEHFQPKLTLSREDADWLHQEFELLERDTQIFLMKIGLPKYARLSFAVSKFGK